MDVFTFQKGAVNTCSLVRTPYFFQIGIQFRIIPSHSCEGAFACRNHFGVVPVGGGEGAYDFGDAVPIGNTDDGAEVSRIADVVQYQDVFLFFGIQKIVGFRFYYSQSRVVGLERSYATEFVGRSDFEPKRLFIQLLGIFFVKCVSGHEHLYLKIGSQQFLYAFGSLDQKRTMFLAIFLDLERVEVFYYVFRKHILMIDTERIMRFFEQMLKMMSKQIYPLSFIFLHFILFFFSACTPKSTLKKDEYLLGSQSFRGNNAVKTEELEPLLPQRPNKRFFGIPGATVALWLYQYWDKRYDREPQRIKLDSLNRYYEQQFEFYVNDARKLSKLRRKYNRVSNKYRVRVEGGNWGMRTFGEPPVYFSEKDARSNVLKIKGYLINQGYRDAWVNYSTDTLLGRIRTT